MCMASWYSRSRCGSRSSRRKGLTAGFSAGIAGGGLGDLGQGSVQDDLFAGRPGRAAAAVDEADFAEGGSPVVVHPVQGRGQRVEGGRGGVGFGVEELFQGRTGDVLDDGDVGGIPGAAGVGQQEARAADVEGSQPGAGGLEQVEAGGVRERIGPVIGAFGQDAVPVVLGRVPDIGDGAGSIVQAQAVDAFLGAAGQPLRLGDPAVGAERRLDDVGELVGVGEASCGVQGGSSRRRSRHLGMGVLRSAIGFAGGRCPNP